MAEAPLPAYLSSATLVLPNGAITTALVQLPETYYGPSIPLGTLGYPWVSAGRDPAEGTVVRLAEPGACDAGNYLTIGGSAVAAAPTPAVTPGTPVPATGTTPTATAGQTATSPTTLAS